jgi:aspartate racemase
MPGHIGIVACSAEGAALCYRTICMEGARILGARAHPEVSMHTHSLAEYMKCIEGGDWTGVAELMLSSANKLATIGADFLICPDNTIHQALPALERRTPRPWLDIAAVVADQAIERGYRRLGLTGTRWLVDSDVYPRALTPRGLELVRPMDVEREEIDRIIFDELVNGTFTAAAVRSFQRVIERMTSEGSRRLLARAAVHRAVHGHT